MVLAALAWGAADGPRAALPFVLVAAPALVLRALPAGRWLDATLCLVLLAAQVGASAGLTDTTNWWDLVAHALTAALLVMVVVRAGGRRSPPRAVALVGVLALAWEAIEALSDAVLGTHFAPTLGDTATDLAAGLLGASAAAVAVAAVRTRPRAKA
jgi:hypothetical protein